MYRIIGVIIVLLFLFVASEAQENKVEKDYKGHHIGGYAGASTGYGLSYRYFPNNIGIQVTTTPIIGSNESRISVGGMLLVSLHKTQLTHLFGYAAHHFHYTNEEYDEEYSSYYYKHEHRFTSTGLGIGFEINISNKVGFNWHLGYAYYTSRDEYSDMENSNDWRTFIDGGTGIFYKF